MREIKFRLHPRASDPAGDGYVTVQVFTGVHNQTLALAGSFLVSYGAEVAALNKGESHLVHGLFNLVLDAETRLGPPPELRTEEEIERDEILDALSE